MAVTSSGLPGFGVTAFLTSDGIPVFRNGSTTDGLTAYGEPVFGLPALGGSNQSVSVPAAAIVVAAQTPTITRTARQSIAVPAAAIVVAGQVPTVSRTTTGGNSVAVPAGAIVVAAQTPTVARTLANYIRVPVASILVNAFAPAVSIGGIVIGGTRPQGAGGVTGGGKRRRTLVEIDGQTFVVRSIDEAEALLVNARAEAEAIAGRVAKTALNKARDVERKTGTLPTLEVAVPALSVAAGADPDIAALVAEAQRGVDEIYLKAAQAVELAWLARREHFRQQEDAEITAAMMADDEEEAAMVADVIKALGKLKKLH